MLPELLLAIPISEFVCTSSKSALTLGQTDSPADDLLRGRDGMPGRDGRDGRDGNTGPPGATGPRGVTGDIGPQGEKGEQGEIGQAGPQGDQGALGPHGEKGDQGEVGPPGPQGDRGLPGPQGPTGISGPQGAAGQKGAHGDSGLPGPQGPQGSQGPPTGGAVYTRWGRTSCPTGQQTELVYSGKAGGSYYGHSGGAANLICMPNDPEYSSYHSGQQGYTYVYGFQMSGDSSQPLGSYYSYNMPCAVCYASTRDTVLTIPAKLNCPTNWTMEYSGYLMAGHYSHTGRTLYECVDRRPERDNSGGSSALLYHVEIDCSTFSCPPYYSEKEITCVVCSR